MVAAWTELCRDIPDDAFIEACKAHLRASPYFPVPANILKAHAEAVPNRPPMFPALEEHTQSPDECHKQAVCAAMFSASMAGITRAKEFFRPGMDWAGKDALARDVLGGRYPEDNQRGGRKEAVSMASVLDPVGVRQ